MQIDSIVQYDEFRLPRESMMPDENNQENEETGGMENDDYWNHKSHF